MRFSCSLGTHSFRQKNAVATEQLKACDGEKGRVNVQHMSASMCTDVHPLPSNRLSRCFMSTETIVGTEKGVVGTYE